ncbi:MAG: helix-turn-helix domain-containing protein [Patescibacteria group bacterium]|nr:helix-turn-helix domain-containing protein [Patescibacteria group bacterium]
MRQLISINKAAELLNVHPNTLKRWDKSGELNAIRFGIRGDRKYREEDLQKFIISSRRKKKIYPNVGPLVAVACMVLKGDKILLGKRTAEMCRGEYCLVGGSLAFGETFEETAKNEAILKANIKISEPRIICVTNNRKNIPKINRQNITIGTIAKYKSGKVRDKQPDRIINWKWYYLDNLPTPIIEADTKIIECYKKGRFYID